MRARLGLLSEVPREWARAVRGWFDRHERYWGEEVADRNLEYLFYQTLVGAWPIETARIKAYMEKAARVVIISLVIPKDRARQS